MIFNNWSDFNQLKALGAQCTWEENGIACLIPILHQPPPGPRAPGRRQKKKKKTQKRFQLGGFYGTLLN